MKTKIELARSWKSWAMVAWVGIVTINSGEVLAGGRLSAHSVRPHALDGVSVSFGGSGCPGGQPLVTDLGDGYLRVEFDSFVVRAGGAHRLERKACAVAITGAALVDQIRVVGSRVQRGNAMVWLSAESFKAGEEGDRMDRFYRDAGLSSIDESTDQIALQDEDLSGILRLNLSLGARTFDNQGTAAAELQALEFRVSNFE
jgi:hypothetical protein